jgi:SNF2 family DNA or RNA helicase
MQKRVSSVTYDNETNQLFAIVQGEEAYEVSIDFGENLDIDDFSCSCPAYEKYEGACKHIVAALFTVKKNSTIPAKAPTPKPKASNHQLLSYYEYANDQIETEAIKLELLMNLEVFNGRMVPSIELKVGMDRMYVIRSMEEFVRKYQFKTQMEFGKNFIYDPYKQKLAGVDKALMSLIEELYENEQLQKNMGYRYYTNQNSAFKGKLLYLSQATLKRILELLENKSFILRLSDREIVNTIIVRQDLPLSFILSQPDGDLKLDLDLAAMPKHVTTDCRYFVYGNNIYHLSDKQMKYFVPIYQEYNLNKEAMVFSGEEKSRFISYVLPFLKKISKVKVDKELEDSLYEADLLAKIYFDKASVGIMANVEFNYNDNKINPFTAANTVLEGDKIIIRDIEGERDVLSSFEQSDFKVRSGNVYLEDEEKIYHFVRNRLPVLQESAEIYYSEDFKKISIKDASAFKGGVRLNHISNLLEFSFHHDDIDGEELRHIFSALRLKRKYFRLKDGSFVPLDDGQMESMAELLDSMDISGDDLINKTVTLPKFRSVYLDSQLKKLNLGHIDRNQAFKQLVQNIQEPQDMEFQIPDSLDAVMRGYQKTGFKWLKTLAAYDMGGILADDMGLGKTLQAIAFILSNKTEKAAPCLVIAPTSLVYNWQEEVYKFAPQLKVLLISGLQKQRQEQIQEINNADIVVTSYPLIRRDIDLYEALDFEYCFLDEAQHIKNPESVNARSVKQIKAKGYFALTGTPIENSLTELWSIFDFVMPGYLLTHNKFMQKYEKPIVKAEDKEALQRLSSQINPFILRRLKKDVLRELPSKIETRLVAELTESQKKVYLAFLQQAKAEIAKELADKGFDKSHIKILALLTRLRQICCHPALFIDDYDGDSGKMALFEELIEEAIEGGHRILLFSQFTSMLKIIEKWLKTQDIDYLYLDGKTPVQQRGELVKAFNAGNSSVFLISLKAGGTGLNLTGADMVIHFDPWWNPAVEDQATDRARVCLTIRNIIFKNVQVSGVFVYFYELS